MFDSAISTVIIIFFVIGCATFYCLFFKLFIWSIDRAKLKEKQSLSVNTLMPTSGGSTLPSSPLAVNPPPV